MENEPVGAIEVYCTQQTKRISESLLSPEKCKLIDAIAKCVGHFLSLQHTLRLLEFRRLPDGDNKSLGDQGSRDETRRSTLQETEYGGLCMTCVHSSTCTFPRRKDHPVLSCEEFDERGENHAETAATVIPPVRKPQAQMTDVRDEPPQYKGLCSTCENRKTCMFPKPEGGVWHCEEFA